MTRLTRNILIAFWLAIPLATIALVAWLPDAYWQ
jgi:hypothetical protein